MPADSIILQYSRALPSAIGGSLAIQFDHCIVNSITGEGREHVSTVWCRVFPLATVVERLFS